MKPVERVIGVAGKYRLILYRTTRGNAFRIEDASDGRIVFRPDTRKLAEEVLTNLAKGSA